jgi:hypothetical protein
MKNINNHYCNLCKSSKFIVPKKYNKFVQTKIENEMVKCLQCGLYFRPKLPSSIDRSKEER